MVIGAGREIATRECDDPKVVQRPGDLQRFGRVLLANREGCFEKVLGTLHTVSRQELAADTMERRTQRLMDLAVRLLEPLMLIVMAGLILFVVIGLLLPVMKSSGTL